MQSQRNALGQNVGYGVLDWKGATAPSREVWNGRFCWLEPLDADQHTDDLFEAQALDNEGRNWTYLSYGPPRDRQEHWDLLNRQSSSTDPLFFAIIDTSKKAVGVAAYQRIFPDLGSIEIGHLYFSPRFQRTAASTETIYLMLRKAFVELGYRRVEWKCDSLNEPSMAAAKRFGFAYEGLFRQASVSKGRNRDTAWYSILDHEWESLGPAYETWLGASNFDKEGRQHDRLSTLTGRVRSQLVDSTVHGTAKRHMLSRPLSQSRSRVPPRPRLGEVDNS
jgi:RimJ/RimL family protein N-acetyltransferase